MPNSPDRVFHVVVHTPDENFGYNILAVDDIIARKECADALRNECANRGITVPEIQFCEIRFIVELTEHKVQLPPTPTIPA